MRRSTSVVASAVAVALLVGACGGGSSTLSTSNGSPGPPVASGVEAKTWAGAVCQDTLDWQTAVGQQSESFSSIVAGAGSLDEAKAAAVSFFDGLITRTESFLSQLRAAGTPAVPNGASLSTSIVSGIQQIDQAYKAARAKAEALTTSDATAFGQQLSAIGADLTAASQRIGSSISALSSPELEAASADVAACQQLVSGGPSSSP
jgi:hypothetical protein